MSTIYEATNKPRTPRPDATAIAMRVGAFWCSPVLLVEAGVGAGT